MKLFLCYYLLLWLVLVQIASSVRVIELGEKFLDYLQNNNAHPWLVMFHAPWCGHCKQLEPTYIQAASEILDENLGVLVGKVDCTKFTSLATHFKIRGFPTVLYIDKRKFVEFNGDRTVKDLVEFTKRLSGPIIRQTDCISLPSLIKTHDVFTIYFGPKPVWKNFSYISQELQSSAWFYQSMTKCENFEYPSIYILKSSSQSKFKALKYLNRTEEPLDEWIISNQFPHFIRISHSNLHSLLHSGKYLVIGLVEEVRSTGKLASVEHENFLNIIENIANSIDDQDLFIFGWTPYFEQINSIVMHTIEPLPNIVVLNTTNLQYYRVAGEPTPSKIIELLHKLKDNDPALEAFGGSNFYYRILRMVYDGYSSMSSMYRGNPVLTLLVFGLPLSFLSIILYSSCCSDIFEADEREEEGNSGNDEEDLEHLKED